MSLFATLGDVKTHLDISSSENDGELMLMLEAAEDVVRSLIDHQFTGAAVTERVTAVGGTVILTGRMVDDVELNGGAVSGFTVNRAAGLLYDVVHVGPLTATYTTGGAGVPASITLATVIITGHLWETQRGTSPSALAMQGDDGALGVPGMGYAIPNRARDLLAPYMRSGSIA